MTYGKYLALENIENKQFVIQFLFLFSLPDKLFSICNLLIIYSIPTKNFCSSKIIRDRDANASCTNLATKYKLAIPDTISSKGVHL